jgi:hypothetical protein
VADLLTRLGCVLQNEPIVRVHRSSGLDQALTTTPPTSRLSGQSCRTRSTRSATACPNLPALCKEAVIHAARRLSSTER